MKKVSRSGGPRRSACRGECIQTSDFPASGCAYFLNSADFFCTGGIGRRCESSDCGRRCDLYSKTGHKKTDTKVRLKGKGVPSLRNSSVRGDHYVTLVIQTPEKLGAEAKEALRKFDLLPEIRSIRSILMQKEGKGKKKGFMEKVKEAFEE